MHRRRLLNYRCPRISTASPAVSVEGASGTDGCKKEGHDRIVRMENLVQVRSERGGSLLDVALIHLRRASSRGEKRSIKN